MPKSKNSKPIFWSDDFFFIISAKNFPPVLPILQTSFLYFFFEYFERKRTNFQIIETYVLSNRWLWCCYPTIHTISCANKNYYPSLLDYCCLQGKFISCLWRRAESNKKKHKSISRDVNEWFFFKFSHRISTPSLNILVFTE